MNHGNADCHKKAGTSYYQGVPSLCRFCALACLLPVDQISCGMFRFYWIISSRNGARSLQGIVGWITIMTMVLDRIGMPMMHYSRDLWPVWLSTGKLY